MLLLYVICTVLCSIIAALGVRSIYVSALRVSAREQSKALLQSNLENHALGWANCAGFVLNFTGPREELCHALIRSVTEHETNGRLIDRRKEQHD